MLYIASTDGMVNEQCIEQVVKGNDCGLILGPIQEFIWRD